LFAIVSKDKIFISTSIPVRQDYNSRKYSSIILFNARSSCVKIKNF
jgi:hypothetical protein